MACQTNASPFSPKATVVARTVKNHVVNLINKTAKEVKETVNKLKVLVTHTIESAKDIAEQSRLKLTREYSQMISKVTNFQTFF